MPVAAGLLTICLVLGAGFFAPTIDNISLSKAKDALPAALAASPDDDKALLKQALETQLQLLKEGESRVDPANLQAARKTLKRPDLQNWIEDYLCPVKDWDTKQTQIRTLVWNKVGDCSFAQRWTARIPALSLFGFWGGLAVLILIAALTITAWMLTFSFHHTRNAYRWLYRSRVF